ncbi:MAG: hypothetical protein KF819_10830 [Labilithrix sp.]|nr:hypothetical protein [Labilithrix sp.]
MRRRIVEAPGAPPRAFTGSTRGFAPSANEEDEDGPPSSVNVARALASLRVGELRRLDAILGADDEPEPAAEPAPVEAPPPSPSVAIGSEIALSDLAQQMGLSPKEMMSALVMRGFYSLSEKTVLARDTARLIAETYGWQVTDAPDAPATPKKKSAKPKAPARTLDRARAPKNVNKSAKVQKSAKGRKR